MYWDQGGFHLPKPRFEAPDRGSSNWSISKARLTVNVLRLSIQGVVVDFFVVDTVVGFEVSAPGYDSVTQT